MRIDTEEQIELAPARLGRALGGGISDLWDRLGLVVASNLIWIVAVLLPWLLADRLLRAPAAGLAVSVLLGAPIIVGTFKMAYNIVYHDDPSLKDLAWGFTGSPRAWLELVLVDILVIGALLTDAAFFSGVFGPLGGNRPAAMLAVAAIYALVLWLVMSLYQFPALAAQKPMSQREGAIPAIKKSLLLAAHNPGFTIGLFVVILGFGVLCALSVIGMLVLYVGAVPIILTHALRELFARYGVVMEACENMEDKRPTRE